MPQDIALSTPLKTFTHSELPEVRSPELFTPSPVVEEEQEPSSSLGDLAKAAKDTEWVFRDGKSFDNFLKSYDEDQPKVSELDWDALSDEWNEDQLEAFRDLVDEKATVEEWNDLQEEFITTNEAQAIVAEHGLTGVGAQFGAALADPTFIAAAGGSIVVGDKVSGVLLAGQRAGRLGRLAATAAKAGFVPGAKRARLAKIIGETIAADGTVMALRNETTHDYSDMDMTIDMLATFAVVGGFESASAIKAAKAAHVLETAQAERLVRGVEANGEAGLLNAGAAKTKTDAGKYRVDDYGSLMNSGNSEAQFFAEHALQDAIGGGSHSAAVQATRMRDHFVGRQNKAFYLLWKEHKKTLGAQGPIKQAKEMYSLSEKLWESVVLGVDHGPEIAKAGKEFAAMNKELLESAQKAEINGFADVVSYDGYMKQEWDFNGWRKARTGPDALDDDEMVDLIHQGLNGFDEVPLSQQLDEATQALDEHIANRQVKREDGVDGFKDEAGDAYAKEVKEIEGLISARKRLALGFSNRMINKSDGENISSLSELMEDPDSLVKWIREDPEFRKMAEDDVKKFVDKALSTRNKGKSNVVDRAKRRISIDPSAQITKGGRVHRVADLMNRDAMGLQQSYAHEMTGNIAFANKLGIKSPGDWNEMKGRARAKEIEIHSGPPKLDKDGNPINKPTVDADAKANAIVDQMEEMKKEIFGHNRYDLSNDWARRGSVLMKYNFMTTMGKAAFSAMSEMGRILAENRARNVLKVLPSFHKIMADSFRNVNKHSSVIKEANSFNASIGDEHLVRYFNSFDETGMQEGRFTDGFLGKAEIVAHRGARIMAKASLLAPMDKMLRFVSFQSSVNSLYSTLMKGQKSRLAFEEMGMSKDLLTRIKMNMQNSQVETDFFGNVTKLNIDKWDRKTADEMMDALTTNGARQVQKTFAGENTWITSHPWGRVFLQFRKFAIDSYSKHLRADIRSARNGQALRVMLSNMYAMILAGAGYGSRTYLSTTGMDEEDRKKVLDEKLAPGRLAANMAAYTPAAGPIVSAWNTGPGWLFPESLGEGGLMIPVSRASGLDNKGIGSNPTSAAAGRFGALFHDVAASEPEDLLDKGRFGIPYQNTLWGDALINTAARAVK